MVTAEKSRHIAQAWIESWNSHDLDSIMSHYSDDVEFTSPFVIRLLGDETGAIEGKDCIRSYFKKGLDTYPHLKFELIKVLSGVNSVTLFYKSVNGMLAAEVMILDQENKICKVIAHYTGD